MSLPTFDVGEEVIVTDPDGAKWNGVVDAPSVLWKDWYAVRPIRRGGPGKSSNYHVHAGEMKGRG